MIAMVDYGRGNLYSLGQALLHLGAEFEITDDSTVIAGADRIILPGVGAFGDAIEGLDARGLCEPLKDAAAAGTPILGICVGCQLLLTRGDEFGEHLGLGLIDGTVRRLPEPSPADLADANRIPNVGWRVIETNKEDPVLGSIGQDEMLYFVHSFAPMVDDVADAVAWLEINQQRVPIAVRRNNILGVQFHPEKSGPVGLALIERFLQFQPS